MNVIQIEIKNKIAELSAPALIVCGNSDYVVEFNFDEEWAEHPVRTARFSTWKGFTDVVFEGSQCHVPALSNASYVKIGVFAGDLRTTTPAYIPCKKSILCEGGAPIEPTPDVYAQLIAMIESGMVRGEQGEKGEKGEKGDAGSIKFIPVPASETDDPKDALPKENIDESAIYIIPDPDGAEENRFIEYVYIAGSWEVLGKISVQVDHSEFVKKTNSSGFFVYVRRNSDDVVIPYLIGEQAYTFPLRDAHGEVCVGTPTADMHAVNKKYAEANFLPLSGGTMTGEIVLGQGDNKGINLGDAGVINSGVHTVLGFLSGGLVVGAYNRQTTLRTAINSKLKVQFGQAGIGTVENVATEKYVDDLIANLQKQIDELKNS